MRVDKRKPRSWVICLVYRHPLSNRMLVTMFPRQKDTVIASTALGKGSRRHKVSDHLLEQPTFLSLLAMDQIVAILTHLFPKLRGNQPPCSPKSLREASGIIYTIAVGDHCSQKHWIPKWLCDLATLPSSSEFPFPFLQNGSQEYGVVLGV